MQQDQEAALTEMMQKVDPNGTGRVTFDAYLDFMTRQATDEDSAEQVLQSFKILAGDKVRLQCMTTSKYYYDSEGGW